MFIHLIHFWDSTSLIKSGEAGGYRGRCEKPYLLRPLIPKMGLRQKAGGCYFLICRIPSENQLNSKGRWNFFIFWSILLVTSQKTGRDRKLTFWDEMALSPKKEWGLKGLLSIRFVITYVPLGRKCSIWILSFWICRKGRALSIAWAGRFFIFKLSPCRSHLSLQVSHLSIGENKWSV